MSSAIEWSFDVLWIRLTNELSYMVNVTSQQPQMDVVVLGFGVTAVVAVAWSLLPIPRK